VTLNPCGCCFMTKTGSSVTKSTVIDHKVFLVLAQAQAKGPPRVYRTDRSDNTPVSVAY
jgi:hypothetical protein